LSRFGDGLRRNIERSFVIERGQTIASKNRFFRVWGVEKYFSLLKETQSGNGGGFLKGSDKI